MQALGTSGKHFLMLVALVLAGEAAWAQPETAPPPAAAEASAETVDNLANVDFRSDIRVFTTMAALNVAGFNFEVPGKPMSALRTQIRQDLAGVNAETKLQLQAFYATRRFHDVVATHTAFTSLALLLDGPPDFKIREDAPQIPEDVQRIQGFEELLPAFYQQAHIEELWHRYAPEYVRELARYRPVMRDVIRTTLEYFRVPARIVLDRQIVLMPDLLAFQDVVHARNLEKDYLIVVGPAESAESNFAQLQHEYLHFLVDPIVEKHGALLLENRDLLGIAHQQPHLSWDFRNRFLLIVGESLIEALLADFRPPDDPREAAVEIFRKGMIFTPYFSRALKEFKTHAEVSLPEFLEGAFKGIKEGEILSDREAIDKLEVKLQEEHAEAEKVRVAEAQAEERRLQESRLLSQAGKQMSERAFEAAKTTLGELRQLDADNGTAYFYLAQISAQQGDQAGAFTYYEKAAASSDIDDWARAWSTVRLGRHLASQGKFAEARKKFETVLQWEGDLRGAKQEAAESIQHLPPAEANP